MDHEQGFLDKLAASRADGVTRLIYADWLDDNDRRLEASFLRFLPALLRPLTDDFEDMLAIRKALRFMRHCLPPTWLEAVGDPGLIGEVLCPAAKGDIVLSQALAPMDYHPGAWVTVFAIVVGIYNAPRPTTLVRFYPRKQVGPAGAGPVLVRPKLPRASRLARDGRGGSALRRPPGFAGRRVLEYLRYRYEFWDGRDRPYSI
jgi:uncharacterized protein (TIGR02996 family)